MTVSQSRINYSPDRAQSIAHDFVQVDCCRACGQKETDDFLDLGVIPLANSLVRQPEDAALVKRFPLSVFFCTRCSLVQLRQTVSPEALFGEYPYFSSFSDTMLESARQLSESVCAARNLNENSLVIEIGSNDGYLLRNYVHKGVPVLGIEPAKNVAAAAREQGVETICEFFGLELSRKLNESKKKADVIHANNVIAHIAPVLETFQAISMLLKNDGVAIIEVPYVKPMIDGIEFDTIYHEHVFYFSLTALDFISNSVGLHILDVEEIEIHGGSIRVTFGRSGEMSPAVTKLLEQELAWGIAKVETYATLGGQVEALGERVKDLLAGLSAESKKLAAYGASAKGSTLLNVFGIGEPLEFVVDRSTAKQGCLMAGTNLEILPPSALIDRKVDFTLLLVWNFLDEVLEQQEQYLQGGGAIIVPLPKMRMVRWSKSENCLEWTIL